jgi:hypothetical protein
MSEAIPILQVADLAPVSDSYQGVALFGCSGSPSDCMLVGYVFPGRCPGLLQLQPVGLL